MKRFLVIAALALTGCVEPAWVLTDVGADEVIREKKVEKSVKVVPYVEPPRVVAPEGGSGVKAAADGHGASAAARCHGGACRQAGHRVVKVVSKLRRR